MPGPVVEIRVHDADDATEDTVFLAGDKDTKSMRVSNMVWNPSTAAWERMKQPLLELTGDLTVTMGDVEKLLAANYWHDYRLAWSSGELTYLGLHTTHKTATSETDWYIWKLTWSSGELTRVEGPLTGSWDGRAALAWG